MPIRAVLLDIEGTTSSLSFVHDCMFPYVRERLTAYLQRHWESAELEPTLDLLAKDAGCADAGAWFKTKTPEEARGQVAAQVGDWMDQDLKLTGLKQLQGQIWQDGFHSGQLIAHVWPEVPAELRAWQAAGLDLRIYSSGSIAAQKLFFGHTEAGDLLPLFSGHYDTTIGPKKEKASYSAISEDWGRQANQIVFLSDVVDELRAAAAAGMQVALSVRPGNPPQPTDFPCLQFSNFQALTPWLIDGFAAV